MTATSNSELTHSFNDTGVSPGVSLHDSPLVDAASGPDVALQTGGENGAGDGTSDESPTGSHIVVTEREKAADGLAREGLSQFFQRGVDSTEWRVFTDAELRLVYVGTPTSNLVHLVRLKWLPTPTLHLPHPPLRPPLPWKPESVWGLTAGPDIANDTACFPSQEVRDALVTAFFEKIHPGFPIIEESLFRSQYCNKDNPPPLLLFQAVLLVGAHACDHPVVASSRMVVMRTLFRRASMLFHLRHEDDRLHMVQAALLFTWHLENADTVCGGSYYWLGIAYRIAYGMGLHRDLSPLAISRLPQWERRMYRRIWWTMFQAEVFSSLEHGRPCMFSLSETDQPQLDRSDFAEGDDGHINDSVRLEYCSKNIGLCFIILQILNLNSPSAANPDPSAVSSIEATLASFALDLPSTTDFWSCQLRMHYNMALLHLHRNTPSVEGHAAADATGAPATAPAPDAKAQEICSDASQAILASMETICNRRWVGQCYFTGVSAIMAAAIQITVDARSALTQGSALLALCAQDRLVRLLDCARELERYWPSAGAIHGLFAQLSDELKVLAKNLQSSSHGMDPQGASDLGWVWDRAFDSFNFAIPTDFNADEWMNDELFRQGLS